MYIGTLMMALLAWVLTGCSSDEEVAVPEKPKFVMYIYLPEQEAVTRGDTDIESDRANENLINTLQVWVFAKKKNSTTGQFESVAFDETDYKTSAGSLYLKVDNVSLTGGVKEVAFYGISSDFKDKYPYLDVYAVANAASLGYDLTITDTSNSQYLGPATTQETLEGLQISGDYFGINAETLEPSVSTVSNKGLPISGCLKQAEVSKQKELFTIASIDMKRAVSKIRFVFSKAQNIPSASVSAIKLDGYVVYSEGNTIRYIGGDGKVIPSWEYLFSDIHAPTGDYSTDFLKSVNFSVPGAIPSHENPWKLRWENEETRQEWEDRLNNAISNGKAVECGRAYLRESPYRLTGTITYTYQEEGDDSATTHTARFTMVDENEFLRNHSWTIYAYFSEGGVVFEVDGWEQQDVTFDPFI